MNTKYIATTVALLAVTAAAGVLAGRALATGAPTLTPLTYAGTITDAAGKPYPAAQDVILKFFDKLDATVAKCTAPLTQAEAGTGRFSVVLPVECVQAVHDAPDLWTEATVGAAKTVLPRTHVGAVPFALEADSAKSAGTAVGAGGALKAQIDGFAADLAGLKAGSGGGGGPSVVDAKGVKVGKMLLVDGVNFRIVTSTGYFMLIRPDGVPGLSQPVLYEGGSCSGKPFIDGASYVLTNRFALSANKKLLVPVGDASGFSLPAATDISYSSAYQSGACVAVAGKAKGIYLKEVTSADIGLPATITPPLTIAP